MSDLNVSRETSDHLEKYQGLVRKWNPSINLVSKSSISTLWERHILDSAQVFPLARGWSRWLDIGSGGGFPGLVVAILARELNPDGVVRMIESDQRKAAFLRTTIRELDLSAEVAVDRVEKAVPALADVVSARALADLPQLMGYAERHLNSSGTAFFFKGETWKNEVSQAEESWSFSCKSHTSKTNPLAAVLEIKEIMRV